MTKIPLLLLLASCSMNPTGLRKYDIERHTLVNQIGFICPDGYYLNANDYKCHLIESNNVPSRVTRVDTEKHKIKPISKLKQRIKPSETIKKRSVCL